MLENSSHFEECSPLLPLTKVIFYSEGKKRRTLLGFTLAKIHCCLSCLEILPPRPIPTAAFRPHLRWPQLTLLCSFAPTILRSSRAWSLSAFKLYNSRCYSSLDSVALLHLAGFGTPHLHTQTHHDLILDCCSKSEPIALGTACCPRLSNA
jgi:hypothetical protein